MPGSARRERDGETDRQWQAGECLLAVVFAKASPRSVSCFSFGSVSHHRNLFSKWNSTSPSPLARGPRPRSPLFHSNLAFAEKGKVRFWRRRRERGSPPPCSPPPALCTRVASCCFHPLINIAGCRFVVARSRVRSCTLKILLVLQSSIGFIMKPW